MVRKYELNTLIMESEVPAILMLGVRVHVCACICVFVFTGSANARQNVSTVRVVSVAQHYRIVRV